jgi:hypothetical protein
MYLKLWSGVHVQNYSTYGSLNYTVTARYTTVANVINHGIQTAEIK